MNKSFTFRGFREDDYQDILNVRLISAKYDHLDTKSILRSAGGATIEELKQSLADVKDKEKNIIIVCDSDKIIGYSYIKWWTENDGTWLYLHLHYLLPEYRKQGIFEKMLKRAENRIIEISKDHPTQGKGVFGSNAASTEKEKTQLLLEHGYKQVFSRVEMVFTDFKNLVDRDFAEGYEIRPVKPEHYRSMWEVLKKAYATREFVAGFEEDDYQEFISNPRNDLSLWHVLWKADELVGYVLSEIRNHGGIITEVVINENHRRKGLASVLLIKNLLALKQKGITEVRLDTNGEDVAGARSMYEKIGFQHIITDYRYRKPIQNIS